MEGYKLLWPPDQLRAENLATDGQVFDAVEYSFQHVAEPKDPSYHSYMQHTHWRYDRETGKAKFEADVNLLFSKQGLAFELKEGEVRRIVPSGLQEALAKTAFRTGEDELNKLLETARAKFFHRALETRKEGLEKLWDAFERLKTIEPGTDKKAQVKVILDKAASESSYRQLLEEEAKQLTGIGNNFMIRHTETNKTPI